MHIEKLWEYTCKDTSDFLEKKIGDLKSEGGGGGGGGGVLH